jgi:hypothetical protein
VRPTRDTDSLRIALALVRADWQDDEEAWAQLWAVADDPAEVARALTMLCREGLEHLALVGGVSTGEMFHRLAQKVIPAPEMATAVVLEPSVAHAER